MRKFNKQTIYNSNGSFVMSDTQNIMLKLVAMYGMHVS